MSDEGDNGCFYLDSCVVLSEVLRQNKTRMTKMKNDVKKHGITCYVSPSVVTECEHKINKTISFLEFILKDVLIVSLEGVKTRPRDLSVTEASNQDLHAIREAFLAVNQTARDYDLVKDPFQVIEEWFVEKLENEVEKSKKGMLSDFVTELTAIILLEITKIKSDFESLVDLEARYITLSKLSPDREIVDLLISKKMHKADAVHISVIRSHQKKYNNKAIFVTFDYNTILCRWDQIREHNMRLRNIYCSDPIYGLSFLR